jgi:hypothetical protein
LTFGSTLKHHSHRFKVAMMNCQFCVETWLIGLATLGQCHRYCNLDQVEWFTLACNQGSGDCLRASFI